jgi:hypothetical protein
MKVDASRATTRAGGAARTAAKPSVTDDAFARALPALDEPPAPAPAGPAVSALGMIDALMCAQEISSDPEGRARAKARGDQLLDRLDALRHALLSGRLSVAELDTLTALLGTERAAITDPALAELLDEIELRARVELAKLGR